MTAGRTAPPADGATWAVREKLDAVDDALVELVADRFRLVGQLWAHKTAVGQTLEDPSREREALRRLRESGRRRGLPPEFVESLFRIVIAGGKGALRRPVGPGSRGRASGRGSESLRRPRRRPSAGAPVRSDPPTP